MATSDFALLTVENTGGALALRRKSAAEVVPESASPVVGTAAGNPAVFFDAAGERVLRSVKGSIEPAQAGTGDPSPDNVRPISGRTAARVYRCGKNIMTEPYDVTKPAEYTGGWKGTSVDADGVVTQTGQTAYAGGYGGVVVYGVPAGTYTLSFDADYSGVTSANCAISIVTRYRGASANNSLFFNTNVNAARPSVTVTLDSDAKWVTLRVTSGTGAASNSVFRYSHIQLEPGSAATEYEPYSVDTFDVAFPSEAGTVYGGTVDPAAGTLTVDRAYINLTGAASESWFKAGNGDGTYFRRTIGDLGSVVDDSGISSHFAATMISGATTDVGQRVVNSTASGAAIMIIRPEYAADATVATFKAWLASEASAGHPVQITYQLTEPAVYPLTPVEIMALEGDNVIWADCGPVSVEYIRDTGAAIEAANADTRAMIGEASGETASRSLAVGEYVTVGAKLYRVTSAVGQGETLVPGTNVVETTVGAELVRLAGMMAQ